MSNDIKHDSFETTRQSGNSESPSVSTLQSTWNGGSDESNVFTVDVLVELGKVVKVVLERLKTGGKYHPP